MPRSVPPGTQWLKIDILDSPSANIKVHLDRCADFIKSCAMEGGKVLIHCYAGISRSTSAVMAHLIRDLNMSSTDAFNLCKSKRSIVNPN